MKTQAWPLPDHVLAGAPTRCRRCGRMDHVVRDDGPAVCRVCLFAWGHYSAMIRRGRVVAEMGGMALRHIGHEVPMMGCPLCRAEQLASPTTFDSWMRGRGA